MRTLGYTVFRVLKAENDGLETLTYFDASLAFQFWKRGVKMFNLILFQAILNEYKYNE